MPAPAVCDRFEQLVDFGFMWAAGQTTVATTYSTGQYFQGEIMTTPISCYELPLWCAQQTGVPSNVIWGVIDDLFRASAQGNSPNQNSILGSLKRYFFNKLAPLRLFGSYPQKGDLVLFSGGTTNYLAHVAMATGNGYEVVSFGHDGPLGAPAAGVARQVERMTINDVLTGNPMLTRVEFGTPPW